MVQLYEKMTDTSKITFDIWDPSSNSSLHVLTMRNATVNRAMMVPTQDIVRRIFTHVSCFQ